MPSAGLLLVDGPLRAEHDPIVAELRELIGAEDRKPGTQQVFGAAASAHVLAGRIGLDEDTNRSLTRRMLLLLESVPVAGDDADERCWVHVLDSYLEDATKDFRPPRFLLNDLVRYWHTICVDFVGKQREDEEKWGLRNAKLRTGRKVLFAGGLLPILLCDRHRQVAMRDFLVEQLRARPPIASPRRSRRTTSQTAVDARWTPTTAGSGCSATTPRAPSWPP